MSLQVDIKKNWKDFSLDVRFDLDKGPLGILGASGCGKSMTLKCIAGIWRPDAGKIVLNGRTLFDSEKKIDLKPQKRRVGYLFQDFALFPNMTVEENVGAGITLPKKEKEEQIHKMIEKFHLMGQEKKYPFQLSGGQKATDGSRPDYGLPARRDPSGRALSRPGRLSEGAASFWSFSNC